MSTEPLSFRLNQFGLLEEGTNHVNTGETKNHAKMQGSRFTPGPAGSIQMKKSYVVKQSLVIEV